ncbi:MAG: endonuclease domain-containing protein [Deltaproteobacteria bacterium]|nr:endonuclease domain-containing protein [Deltaproteobacteria bacterium]
MKSDPRTRSTRARSRALRREGSDAEAALWRRLRARRLAGAKFRRQHPIGPYFADFCCVEARLVVEIDGGQHAAAAGRDGARTACLAAHGFRVIRFWNHDVLEKTEAVLQAIGLELGRALGAARL